mgnify:CR=1 FL=1
MKQKHNFKVFVDPSHASGNRNMIRSLCHVAMASVADGLLVESHPTPECALSDKDQQITPSELNEIRSELERLSTFFDKKLI